MGERVGNGEFLVRWMRSAAKKLLATPLSKSVPRMIAYAATPSGHTSTNNVGVGGGYQVMASEVWVGFWNFFPKVTQSQAAAHLCQVGSHNETVVLMLVSTRGGG